MDFFIVLWFLSGILGYHLGEIKSRKDCSDEGPEWVWISVLGPLALLAVVLILVRMALSEKEA
jgi:hypothetical protein